MPSPVATFSLVRAYKTHADGTVDGYWVQDCVGTLEEAWARAATATGSGMPVVVVEGLPSGRAPDVLFNLRPVPPPRSTADGSADFAAVSAAFFCP